MKTGWFVWAALRQVRSMVLVVESDTRSSGIPKGCDWPPIGHGDAAAHQFRPSLDYGFLNLWQPLQFEGRFPDLPEDGSLPPLQLQQA